MKYVALLRGINVGGHTLIKMAELKEVFEKAGYKNIVTYINSGNVIFESDEKSLGDLEEDIEKRIEKTFKLNVLVVVLSGSQLKKVVGEVPKEWNKNLDIRCYIAFLKKPLKPKDVVEKIKINETVDSIEAGSRAVYMTTKMSGLTRSGFTKMASTPIYKSMTIRNYNTVLKILNLME